jgi:hypothetical protein
MEEVIMKSTAKSILWTQELKAKLGFRGLTVVESRNSEGYGRLVLETDQASVEIISEDAVSKDVFGQSLVAFAPHYVKLAIDSGINAVVYAKVMLELGKLGIKIKIHSGADLAAAEAAAATAELEADIQHPSKGM